MEANRLGGQNPQGAVAPRSKVRFPNNENNIASTFKAQSK